MTTLNQRPHIVRVKRLRDAAYAECRTCEHIVQAGLFWGLSKTMHLHTSGTGHRTFKLFGWDQASKTGKGD